MRFGFYRILVMLYICLNLSACGTMISLVEKDYSVYAGVTKNFYAIQEGGIIAVLAVIDLPLSFVLDTLMLPVTLSHE
ncbi:YceK/YidQ family lipoprotein [Mannheimia sp. AT1]|uniref:YceK/YidQ family lipoprotein n=1 Tax=Mannheimia cairinae TaxID=3025936 RepID=A0ABT5MLH5_9PAST|nr:YceK/YidQ family lipoprotein [Mannheimia cairinae]MDD0823049.1 YceK/YidQ family lipoprotein [Mannheimia cairinae]MDD0825926.1 YceK/YidQ family lipoprotein [Mannheimia cairinae]